jgi:hypothetical protein
MMRRWRLIFGKVAHERVGAGSRTRLVGVRASPPFVRKETKDGAPSAYRRVKGGAPGIFPLDAAFRFKLLSGNRRLLCSIHSGVMCPPISDAKQRRAFAGRAEAFDGGH